MCVPFGPHNVRGRKVSEFAPSQQAVRAYDKTLREVIRTKKLALIIGPVECET